MYNLYYPIKYMVFIFFLKNMGYLLQLRVLRRNKTIIQMKNSFKVAILALAIAVSAAACKGKSGAGADSTAKAVDTTAKAVDTTKKAADTSKKAAADTTKKDTTKKK